MNPVETLRHGLTHYEYVRSIEDEEEALAWVESLVEAASETARLYPYEGRLVRAALACEQPSELGSSAADVDGAEHDLGHHEPVGERQGRQPGSEDLSDLIVELARWSRVAERNGDLHARIASALAGDGGGADEDSCAHGCGRG